MCQIIDMTQFTNSISDIPANYPFRYTLDYHIRMIAAKNNMGVLDVVKELVLLLEAAGVGLSERQFHRYRIEPKDSSKEELSHIRREVIGGYLDLEADALITGNIIHSSINEL